MTNIRPLHDRILVKRVPQEEKTSSGIYIPDTAKEKPVEGVVVAVGKGLKNESGALIPMDVQKGDKIIFAKWGGTEIKIEGVEYLIMKEADVLGIVESAK